MWALLIGAGACNPTEPPYRNAYWDNYREGLYVDAVNGEPLFSSRDKYDAGTGWPSFTQPIEPERVVTRSDWSYGALRTEVRSSGSDVHLGHVFGDGPAPTGLRYCINSFALRFIPTEDLEGHGYREYRSVFFAAPQAGSGVIQVSLSDRKLPEEMAGEEIESNALTGDDGFVDEVTSDDDVSRASPSDPRAFDASPGDHGGDGDAEPR